MARLPRRRVHDPELTYVSKGPRGTFRVRVTVVLMDGSTTRESLGLFASRDEAVQVVSRHFKRHDKAT